jgi:predicted transport protein
MKTKKKKQSKKVKLAPAKSQNNDTQVKPEAFTEEYHLKDATEDVKQIYSTVKKELLKVNKQLRFNPQKYYISIKKDKSIAFFHFSRKRINLVVKHPEKDTRKQIKHHEIKTLTESVQKFWNGPSCTIVIEGVKHLQEVIVLLKRLVKP